MDVSGRKCLERIFQHLSRVHRVKQLIKLTKEHDRPSYIRIHSYVFLGVILALAFLCELCGFFNSLNYFRLNKKKQPHLTIKTSILSDAILSCSNQITNIFRF